MPKVCYVPRTFSAASLDVIEQANSIVVAYAAQGFNLTLRQLYYQFVSRGLIANRQSEYKRLGSIINDARLAGLIDWTYIEDRTRALEANPSWDDPSEIIESAAKSYGIDKWEDQPYRQQVWIEWHATNDRAWFRSTEYGWEREAGFRGITVSVPMGRRPPIQTGELTGTAMVPLVPPAQKGPRNLANHFVLWEVEQWAMPRQRPRADYDPYLLRHLAGDLYMVVAEWDLTEVERAIMGQRAE